jgi:hypothetical protein
MDNAHKRNISTSVPLSQILERIKGAVFHGILKILNIYKCIKTGRRIISLLFGELPVSLPRI